jgi:hypothetical protein
MMLDKGDVDRRTENREQNCNNREREGVGVGLVRFVNRLYGRCRSYNGRCIGRARHNAADGERRCASRSQLA